MKPIEAKLEIKHLESKLGFLKYRLFQLPENRKKFRHSREFEGILKNKLNPISLLKTIIKITLII